MQQPKPAEEEKAGWLARLKSGLSKTSDKIGSGITTLLFKHGLSDEALEKLEELLIEADMGVSTSAKIIEAFREHKFESGVAEEVVKEALAAEIAKILSPSAKSLSPSRSHRPFVMLMVGVNGNGKTTTIGKLGHNFNKKGLSLMFAACDTFRAAAVEQLKVWGLRTATPVVTGETASDPASVAYAALERAKHESKDVLLIDTAGRLQNKNNLMAELQKLVKVLKKIDTTAPHEVVLVVDGTTGQNAISQVAAFKEVIGLTGLVVTKLDGTAKGGVVVALAHQFGLPIYAVGVGEGIEDFRAFDADSYARGLVGL